MDQDILKIVVDDLRKRCETLREQKSKTEDAIKALQEICEHMFTPAGSDSHYSYEKCIYCGIEQKV